MNDYKAKFWSKVDKSGSCWVWQGSLSNGYGHFRVGNRTHPAHRLSYMLTKGEIPAGLHTDHLCRNRACVNPDHLEAVTRKVNILRGVGAPAIHARKTKCKKGHPFTPENTRMRAKGRVCRKCQVLGDKRHRLKQAALKTGYASTSRLGVATRNKSDVEPWLAAIKLAQQGKVDEAITQWEAYKGTQCKRR